MCIRDSWYSAQKKGYSGVGIISKHEPNNVIYGTGISEMDFEGRNLRVDFDQLTIMSLYLPSGTNLERLEFKLSYMDKFYDYVSNLKKTNPNDNFFVFIMFAFPYIITKRKIMSVKLGIAPIAWSNDDMPELGGDTPLEQCLSEANEAGFSGIESGGKFPKKSEELIPLLEKYNLKLCSGWYGANLRKNSVKEEINAIQEQLKLFQDCKASCIVFAEVSDSIAGDPSRPLSTRPQMDGEEWNSFCKKISEIGKYLEDQGMPLAYHHHMGTVIESQKDTERLLESTKDQVKLILDT